MEKTKKVLFGEILAIEGIQKNEELVKFIKHELELLDKKTTSKKPTKAQEENVSIKAEVLEILSMCEKPRSIKDLQAEFPELAKYSNQKISALLKQLIGEEKVVRTEEKRIAMFAIPTEEVEEDNETQRLEQETEGTDELAEELTDEEIQEFEEIVNEEMEETVTE